MKQEEKAKRYDEILESIKELYSKGSRVVVSKEEFENIFHELAESEDERISREITKFILTHRIDEPNDIEDTNSWLAWLEKQGKKEQDVRYENLEELLAADDIYQMAMNDEMVQEAKEKAISALSEMCIGRLLLEKQVQLQSQPTWSEEDENRMKKVMHILSLDGRISNEELKSIHDWLKSLKERVQPKKGWSEEDSKVIDNCCLLIAAADDSYEKAFKDDCIHYLQNLKQRMEV